MLPLNQSPPEFYAMRDTIETHNLGLAYVWRGHDIFCLEIMELPHRDVIGTIHPQILVPRDVFEERENAYKLQTTMEPFISQLNRLKAPLTPGFILSENGGWLPL